MIVTIVCMGRIAGHYEWDDDGLTPGHKSEGGLHQNLFDDEGKLKGHARFVPADDDDLADPLIVTETVYVPVGKRRNSKEQEELNEAISDLLTVLIYVGYEKAKPHVQHWWQEFGRPFVGRQWGRLKRSKPSPQVSQTSVIEAEAQNLTSDSASGLAVQEPDRPLMSTAEAQARMLAAIAAQAFADEQMRLVNGAEIVDGENADAVREAISKLPPEIVAELVKNMATNPSLFDEESLAELASILVSQAERRDCQVQLMPTHDDSN